MSRRLGGGGTNGSRAGDLGELRREARSATSAVQPCFHEPERPQVALDPDVAPPEVPGREGDAAAPRRRIKDDIARAAHELYHLFAQSHWLLAWNSASLIARATLRSSSPFHLRARHLSAPTRPSACRRPREEFEVGTGAHFFNDLSDARRFRAVYPARML